MSRKTGSIQEDRRYHAGVWFNTWQYSQFIEKELLPAAMLLNLVRKLERIAVDHDARPDDKVLKRIKDFAQLLSHISLSLANKQLLGGILDVDRAMGAFSSGDDIGEREGLGTMEQLRNNFELIVKETNKKISGKGGADRIVFYIDDLDRLEPDRAIELLEVIKNFLDVPGCVFVLAIDYEVITRGLAKRKGYAHGDQGEIEGKSFFDKIIQVPYRMPTDDKKVSEFLKAQIASEQFRRNEAAQETLKEFLGYHGDDLVKNSFGANPRAAKRLLNLYVLLLRLLQSDSSHDGNSDKPVSPEQAQQLLVLTAIQISHLDMYGHLLQNAQRIPASLLGFMLLPKIMENSEHADSLSDGSFEELIDSIEDRAKSIVKVNLKAEEGGETDVEGSLSEGVREVLSQVAQRMNLKSRVSDTEDLEYRKQQIRLERMANMAWLLWKTIDTDGDNKLANEYEVKEFTRILDRSRTTAVQPDDNVDEPDASTSRSAPVTFSQLRKVDMIKKEARLRFKPTRKQERYRTAFENLKVAPAEDDKETMRPRVRFDGMLLSLTAATRKVMEEIHKKYEEELKLGEGGEDAEPLKPPLSKTALQGGPNVYAYWEIEIPDGTFESLNDIVEKYREVHPG